MKPITDEELEEMAWTCIKENIKPWHVCDVPMPRFLAIYERVMEANLTKKERDAAQMSPRFGDNYGDHLDDPDNVESSAHYLPRVGFQSQRKDPYYDRSSWGNRNRSDYWRDVQDTPYSGLFARHGDSWGRHDTAWRGGGYRDRVLDFPRDLEGAIAWLEKQPGGNKKAPDEGKRKKGSGEIRDRLKGAARDSDSAGHRSEGKPHGGRQGKKDSDRGFRALYREVFPWLTERQKVKATEIHAMDRDMYFLGIPDVIGDTVCLVTKGFEFLMRPNGRLMKRP